MPSSRALPPAPTPLLPPAPKLPTPAAAPAASIQTTVNARLPAPAPAGVPTAAEGFETYRQGGDEEEEETAADDENDEAGPSFGGETDAAATSVSESPEGDRRQEGGESSPPSNRSSPPKREVNVAVRQGGSSPRARRSSAGILTKRNGPRRPSNHPAVQALAMRKSAEQQAGGEGRSSIARLSNALRLRGAWSSNLVSTTDLSGLLCASVTGTCVVCVTDPPPPRPSTFDGYVMIFEFARYMRTQRGLVPSSTSLCPSPFSPFLFLVRPSRLSQVRAREGASLKVAIQIRPRS